MDYHRLNKINTIIIYPKNITPILLSSCLSQLQTFKYTLVQLAKERGSEEELKFSSIKTAISFVLQNYKMVEQLLNKWFHKTHKFLKNSFNNCIGDDSSYIKIISLGSRLLETVFNGVHLEKPLAFYVYSIEDKFLDFFHITSIRNKIWCTNNRSAALLKYFKKREQIKHIIS